MNLLWIYLVGINLVAFLVCAWDKHSARRHAKRRVPEARLFLLALLGGALGMLCGMLLLRHKTRHWYFMVGIPAILVLEVAGILTLIVKLYC